MKKKKSQNSIKDLLSKIKKLYQYFLEVENLKLSVITNFTDFVKLMNKKDFSYSFVFHATDENKEFIINQVKKLI